MIAMMTMVMNSIKAMAPFYALKKQEWGPGLAPSLSVACLVHRRKACSKYLPSDTEHHLGYSIGSTEDQFTRRRSLSVGKVLNIK